MKVIDLSENQLTGEIPPELGSYETLISLNLSKNQLTGEIPSELGNLDSLDSLPLGQPADRRDTPGVGQPRKPVYP